MERERLGSRLGFILLSAGCAIGCGNVWKFPWMTGQYGGGAFVLVYLICLVLLGLPVMTMEFALGRAAQKSPVKMYQQLEKKGQYWHVHGIFAFIGNIALMAFYTVVTGWMIYYFYKFLIGQSANLSFGTMISNAQVNVKFLAIAIVVTFVILCFDIQKGLEGITKYMMLALFILMIGLAVYACCFLPNAKEGLKFYLVPDFTKINGSVVVGAMNQAFFTLSLGIGSMAIFGSYIGKDRALTGESLRIISLDTLAAILAGLIIFPVCSSYGLEVSGVGAGPALLFNTMAEAFNHLAGGRILGTLFFLFMTFAALSTMLAVCENIIACFRDLTGMKRLPASIICGVGIFLIALTTALGYSKLHFQPFAEGSAWLDFWDFIVSTNLLPVGAMLFCLFINYEWGWKNFIKEANTGKGLKFNSSMPMRIYCTFLVPLIIAGIYLYGLFTFPWK